MQKGITLIELLVVLAIISILALVAYAGLSGARIEAKKATVKASMDSLRPAAEVYALQNTANPYTYINFCTSTAVSSVETACQRVYSDCGCDGTPRGACSDGETTWSVNCVSLLDGGFNWTCDQNSCHE